MSEFYPNSLLVINVLVFLFIGIPVFLKFQSGRLLPNLKSGAIYGGK